MKEKEAVMIHTTFTIDGDKLDVGEHDANTFKGFGLLSCNNSSRLLMDYKWEHPDSYRKILTGLFGGKHPLVDMVKVELGNDANTSSGTEPAPKRAPHEEANVRRGMGYQLAADAKEINPTIKTCLLRWGEPGYLRPTWMEVKSSAPDQKVPESAYESMYQLYKQTIVAAYQAYGFMFDYVDPDRNETKHPMYRWIKWFAKRLQKDEANFPAGFPINQFHRIKVMAADQNYETEFGDGMLSDAELRKLVPAVGYHYNTNDGTGHPYRRLADEYQHEVWYSEGISPMTMGKYRVRATNEDGIGGRQSSLDVANRIIKGYVMSRRTHYIFQPAISAYYPGVNYSHKELVKACYPWSGYFEPDEVGLQVIRHFTDFTVAGWHENGAWRFLPSACNSGVGGTENLDTDTEQDSYITLVSPDKRDYSVIFVNDSAVRYCYQIQLKHLGSTSQKLLNIWQTMGPKSKDDAYDSQLKQRREQLKPSDGQVMIEVLPHSIVTATTLINTGDQQYRPFADNIPDNMMLYESPKKRVLFSDDFNYPTVFLQQRGGTPRYLTDQGGAFEVERVTQGQSALVQQITERKRALDWEYSYAPSLTFGDDRWHNYEVCVKMKFDVKTQQNSANGNYFGIGLYQVTDVKGRLNSAAYSFKLSTDGHYEFFKHDKLINQGYIDGMDLNAPMK
ncbi:glycosyl hydrolase [Secundilactobacillus kimchicus]|uniref:glycosyl hydrolase n=1 Tax=Secundilactobacillus kimchicus TaxID=528209 RepID=UPI0024A940B1|nr:glycosyl hydrolase [Secundilactobacillus kimchicus]